MVTTPWALAPDRCFSGDPAQRSRPVSCTAYGSDPRFRIILFTLDESAYSRELAPLAGYYPAVLIGPPWWFHDSVNGMRRYFGQVIETAGFYNLAGFNDDSDAEPVALGAKQLQARFTQALGAPGAAASERDAAEQVQGEGVTPCIARLAKAGKALFGQGRRTIKRELTSRPDRSDQGLVAGLRV
jgi:hypothetical protein